jgi:hypothetical protein
MRPDIYYAAIGTGITLAAPIHSVNAFGISPGFMNS